MNAQKGGVGKTYLSLALASAAERDGLRTVVLDLDVQETLHKLVELRDEKLPTPTTLDENPKPEDVGIILDALRDDYDICFIDTPGAVHEWTPSVMQHADFVIIPTGTSTPDLLSISKTQDLAKQIDKPFAFVLSKVSPRGGRAADVAEQLKEYGHICESQIKYRAIHENATDSGRTALDSNRAADADARAELEAIWMEVRGLANV